MFSGATISADCADEGTHIGHRTGDGHTGQLAQAAHFGRRVGTDDQQLELRTTCPQQRPDLRAEARHALLVRIVVHAADETQIVSGSQASAVGEKKSASTPFGNQSVASTCAVALERLPFGARRRRTHRSKLQPRQALLGRKHLECLRDDSRRQGKGL
jgi:hypothetical protein